MEEIKTSWPVNLLRLSCPVFSPFVIFKPNCTASQIEACPLSYILTMLAAFFVFYYASADDDNDDNDDDDDILILENKS